MASKDKSKIATEWRKNNPEKAKIIQEKYRSSEKYVLTYANSHLKRKYGITYEDYLSMYELQNKSCKICGKSELRRNYQEKREQLLPLFVDHCHKTGKVRGLLCSKCNTGIGMFEDSIENLTSAISYLKENYFG